MGVIFRNGIPYGATESDVTSVAQYADLLNLDEKKAEHLYIVEETSKPYRYDINTGNFVLLDAKSDLKITTNTINGITTVTFFGTQSEAPVSFTLSELADLKARLLEPHLSQLTQEEYNELDPPDTNTVYVIGEGNDS